MKLSATDKAVLSKAINNKPHSKNKVHACSLEKKREFNSALKLVKHGFITGNVSYQHANGYACTGFGRTWVNGKSWNEFSGQLTDKGVSMANELANQSIMGV